MVCPDKEKLPDFIVFSVFSTLREPLRANISETVLVLLINERGEKEKGRDEREFSRCCSFSFTAEYKLSILQEAEAVAARRGGIGALLRREGLYSSLLATWRRERADGILEALTPRKRGPKSKRNPLEEENLKLQRQNARLTEDLRKAHIIIDVQKKVAALLGRPIPEPDPEENS